MADGAGFALVAGFAFAMGFALAVAFAAVGFAGCELGAAFLAVGLEVGVAACACGMPKPMMRHVGNQIRAMARVGRVVCEGDSSVMTARPLFGCRSCLHVVL